jgi:dTDP-4-dehydrorhamnose reductase
MSSGASTTLELWGGVECTINRVGDVYFDQLAKSGHRQRVDADLERFAALGIRTLRTSIHWEYFDATQSWEAADRLFASLNKYNIRPIVGLLHHGSGPPSTHLLDPDFPEKLAAFALQVARRYPSVAAYTPVNEPQTTGRFACLYGHWFPHERSMRSYVRALFHQVKGTVLAMESIRTINSDAQLISTEDAGQIFSTPPLEIFRQEREHRRWLGTDLLCGLVGRNHPLFTFLIEHGLSESEVLWFEEHPCAPSVIGLNYYVTSDRFLDHRLDLYPDHFAGGDTGREPLVDFEAVRVYRPNFPGVGPILEQAWERYGIPVAITEAHIGSDPDAQVQWLAEVWRDSLTARKKGIDVRAVTVWALLGSFNWCHLCTQDTNTYEPGVFDLTSGVPAATALTGLLATLPTLQPLVATADAAGWWHHPQRFTVAENSRSAESAVARSNEAEETGPNVGANEENSSSLQMSIRRHD